MNVKLILIFFLIISFTSSCSYQKMNSIDQKRVDIQEFEVTGGARESFVLQKKIYVSYTKIFRAKCKTFFTLSLPTIVNLRFQMMMYHIHIIISNLVFILS